jgi:hypothetical protein
MTPSKDQGFTSRALKRGPHRGTVEATKAHTTTIWGCKQRFLSNVSISSNVEQ